LSLAPGKGWYRCPDIENCRRRFLMEDSKWRNNGARSWPKRRFLVYSPLLWLLMQMKPYEKFNFTKKKIER